ncbi:MAG: response regulator [Nocardioides sp.]
MTRIVLAEDNQDIRELIVMTLERQSYDVVACATGDQALQDCLEEAPDLVLLDISMPGQLDGLDVTRSLRADSRTAEVPVILLTARAQEADVLSGMTAGANDYLVKPFSPRQLVARIAALISP